MAYNKTVWENLPSTNTPINASNLNKIENEVETLDNCRLKKLWENPNPTSNFAAQDVNLSSDDYDYLICFFKNAAGNQYQKSVMILKGAGGMLEMAWDYGIGGVYYIAEYYRAMARVNDTKYTIGNCNIRYNSGTTQTTDNAYVIPVYIYGGKF